MHFFKVKKYRFILLVLFFSFFAIVFAYAAPNYLLIWRVNKRTSTPALTQIPVVYTDRACKVVKNDSVDKDYLVPAGTKSDWDAFRYHLPPGVTLENCPCTSFTYSPWSACVNNSQTRDIISASPWGCVGGSPVLSQYCNCDIVGCLSGFDCRQGTLYYGSDKCKGASNPISPTCVANSVPYYQCQKDGVVSRTWWGVNNNLCTTVQACPTPTNGCPTNHTCVTSKVYFSSDCTTNYTGTINGPYCHPNYGQAVGVCVAQTDDHSVFLTPATGCTYNP